MINVCHTGGNMVPSFPIEISKNFFLYRSPEKDFHRNIYLKRFVGKNRTMNMIFDPGTGLDVKTLREGFGAIIGDLRKIDIIFLSHQDPDVTANVPLLMKQVPRSLVLASVDTWRLVELYGLPEKRFFPTEKYLDGFMRIKPTGHFVKVIPARFCHFRGAMMLYDVESRTLFTGDFLGGVNTRRDKGYIATEESWDGISLFHQLYMPSSKALQLTIDLISALDPFPEIIAPQHGDIITGELIYKFLGNLSNLEVGIDFMLSENSASEKAITVINSFLSHLRDNYGDQYTLLMKNMDIAKDFSKSIEIKGDRVNKLKASPDVAFQQIYSLLSNPHIENYSLFQETFLQDLEDADLHFIPHDKDRELFSISTDD
jgi:glyoxylase-like metal-dependent hydrolase (beta-lactamase superfamily II)